MRLAAWTLSSLVAIDGISGLRYTLTFDSWPVSATSMTGSIRPIIAGAVSGRVAAWPVSVVPLVTVSRLVPSWLISASSPAWEDEERPSTATIAAAPIAIPNADSAALTRRVVSPTLATRAMSPDLRRAWTSCVVALWLMLRSVGAGGLRGAGVRDDQTVAHMDLALRPVGEVGVVGDDDDRRALGVELLQQLKDLLAGVAVEVAGRLVGEDDRGAADQGAGDRDPLALPTGHGCGTGVLAVGEPNRVQRLGGELASLTDLRAGIQQPVRDVVEHGLVLGEEAPRLYA